MPVSAPRGARDVANSPWLARLARLGLGARGVIYLLIGWLALQVAFGGRRQTDQNGALRTVAAQPFGKLLLWLLALGFAGYALWRFSEAAYGEVGGDGGAKGRVKSLVRGLVYAALCASAVSIVTGGSGRGSSAQQNQALSARLMQHGWGRILVGLVGLILIGVGVMLVLEGVQRKFLKQLRTAEMSPGTRTAVERLGMFGTAARGAVFALAGYFVLQAAFTFDPKKARGLDAALHSLAGTALGPWLLALAALGLVAFGLYGLAEARYRRTER